MTKTVLILGATGRFGRNAALAFETAGWRVRRFDRKTDTLETAARGVDVIVNAWNPPYSKWSATVLQMQPQVHRAALANDALVIIPGNVYVYGDQTPTPWSDATPHIALNDLCRIRVELERSYQKAGVRTLVLRGGDYLDTEPSGNWFDKVMAPSLAKDKLTFPGPENLPRAWAYLPDITRAAVMLAEKRDRLRTFEDVCFPGYTLSGQQMADLLAEARGHDVRVTQLAWWQLRLVQPFWAEVKHLFEMRYIWNMPHALDGTKFDALLPEFQHTTPKAALFQAASFVGVPNGAGRRSALARA